jgi:hypothetical protein
MGPLRDGSPAMQQGRDGSWIGVPRAADPACMGGSECCGGAKSAACLACILAEQPAHAPAHAH